MGTNHVSRTVKTLIGGAETRLARFDGEEHLVVPVVALKGDIVLRPLGSTGPEFVPAAELSAAPMTWNNRPVVDGHPKNNSGSANEIQILESQAFGIMLNTLYDDGLKSEAWLSRVKANKLGGSALDTFNRAEAGEEIEVSIGVLVRLEQRNGTSPSGEEFEFVWHDLISDHLAFLPKGSTGACSIDDGCGAPRLNTHEPLYLMRAASKQGTWDKIKSSFSSRSEMAREAFRLAAHDPSDEAIRGALWSELMATEPSFLWIEEVRQGSGTVFYSVDPRGEFQTFSRLFTVVKNGDSLVEITLGDDRTPVEMTITVEFRPLEDQQTGEQTMNTPCQCKAKVSSLIANNLSHFTEDHRSFLEGVDESTIDAFVAQCVEPVAVKPPAPEPVAPTTEPAPNAEPDGMKALQDELAAVKQQVTDMKPAADAHVATLKAKKDALAQAIFDTQGKDPAYTLEALQLKTLDELKTISHFANVDEPVVTTVSYAGARTGKHNDTTVAPVPPTMSSMFSKEAN